MRNAPSSGADSRKHVPITRKPSQTDGICVSSTRTTSQHHNEDAIVQGTTKHQNHVPANGSTRQPTYLLTTPPAHPSLRSCARNSRGVLPRQLPSASEIVTLDPKQNPTTNRNNMLSRRYRQIPAVVRRVEVSQAVHSCPIHDITILNERRPNLAWARLSGFFHNS